MKGCVANFANLSKVYKDTARKCMRIWDSTLLSIKWKRNYLESTDYHARLRNAFSICSSWHPALSPATLSNGAQEKSGVENGEEDYCQRNHPVWISIVCLKEEGIWKKRTFRQVQETRLPFASTGCPSRLPSLGYYKSMLVVRRVEFGMTWVRTDKCNGSKP